MTVAPNISSDQSGRQALFAVIKEKSFATGDFTLTSGRKSTSYFNLKPTILNPEGAYFSTLLLLDLIDDFEPDFVGGLEVGAIPLLGSLAAQSFANKRPVGTFFVRKVPKGHGTQALIEGLKTDSDMRGARIVIVDDVATTGGSILKAAKAVLGAGGKVVGAVCLLDREEGASDAIAPHDIQLRSVFKASEFQ